MHSIHLGLPRSPPIPDILLGPQMVSIFSRSGSKFKLFRPQMAGNRFFSSGYLLNCKNLKNGKGNRRPSGLSAAIRLKQMCRAKDVDFSVCVVEKGAEVGVGEGKRAHLVRWDVVCKPKTIGGLGLGNISWRNLALLGKWLWRYPREGSALWHQVILNIYGSHSNGWDANTFSQMVTSLSLEDYCSSLSGVFFDYSVCGRKRKRIRFWEDLWWGDQPLGTQYPRLFRVVVDKNISISSVLGPSRPFSWNLNFRRNLSDSEIEDLEGLMRSLDDLYLSPSVPDSRLWPLSLQGFLQSNPFF
ncbi:hypothetical protein CK203_032960 [Vitis vinifera]|uniref:Uncharacterized protein n=1 Tax=Vitis vinifera TaxID=29760 RepID=A0A438HVX2_VITVI|nr:hypothetical protein CK203_032960 [Vitis vinifera]